MSGPRVAPLAVVGGLAAFGTAGWFWLPAEGAVIVAGVAYTLAAGCLALHMPRDTSDEEGR